MDAPRRAGVYAGVMATLIGLSGSLRSASFNTKLLHAAVASMPDGSTLDPRTLHGIPLYNGDVEAEGIPASVAALKNAIAAADGLLLVTPEYNNGIPGVFKNAIDWLSRPSADRHRVFGGKPVAVIGASTGGFGTVLAQTAWLPVLRTLGTRIYTGHKLTVSKAKDVFEEDGTIADEAIRDRLAGMLEGFVREVERAESSSS